MLQGNKKKKIRTVVVEVPMPFSDACRKLSAGEA